jgi:hypothetical protein
MEQIRSGEQREARLAVLETKVSSGDVLTKGEKASLTRLRKPLQSPARPSHVGRPEVKIHSDQGVVVYGGKPAMQGKAHPNLLRGSDRHFGAKLADPGKVFAEAVEAEVAARLARAPETPAQA